MALAAHGRRPGGAQQRPERFPRPARRAARCEWISQSRCAAPPVLVSHRPAPPDAVQDPPRPPCGPMQAFRRRAGPRQRTPTPAAPRRRRLAPSQCQSPPVWWSTPLRPRTDPVGAAGRTPTRAATPPGPPPTRRRSSEARPRRQVSIQHTPQRCVKSPELRAAAALPPLPRPAMPPLTYGMALTAACVRSPSPHRAPSRGKPRNETSPEWCGSTAAPLPIAHSAPQSLHASPWKRHHWRLRIP